MAQTAPYGHSGAYDTLEAVVRHLLDLLKALYSYDSSQLRLPHRPDLDAQDLQAMDDPAVVAGLARANELSRVDLSDREIRQLMDFLYALTDSAMLDLRGDIPKSLPSGLPLGD